MKLSITQVLWNFNFSSYCDLTKLPAGISGHFIILFLGLISSVRMAEKQELQAVLKGNGLLTKNLYNELAKEPGNVFFSPISIHTVLSMAYQGSRGRTSEAFSAVLNVPDPKVAAEGYKDVISRLNNVPNVTLLIANKVFLKSGYLLQASFKDVISKSFLSEVQLVDFQDNSNAAKTINGWVEEKTKNKIKDLISADSLNSDTRLVLVNAIYFKGNWADKFDPKNTQTEKFYLNDNDTVDVQMMSRKAKYHYKLDEALDAQVLELPYANKDLSLIVILPTKRNGIAELEKKLAETDLTKITDGMQRPEVNVRLPKFKIEKTINLEDVLTKMGLGIIFEMNKADFGGLIESKESFYVSQVVQKAFIEVNEEGSEAAAATGLQIQTRCLTFAEEFTADHPFIIALIVSNDNMDNVLFSGRIAHPQ